VEELLEGDVAVAVRTARLVGGYALALTFDPDGHDTGIYPFGLLRSLADEDSGGDGAMP
jgi:DUF971 family protein